MVEMMMWILFSFFSSSLSPLCVIDLKYVDSYERKRDEIEIQTWGEFKIKVMMGEGEEILIYEPTWTVVISNFQNKHLSLAIEIQNDGKTSKIVLLTLYQTFILPPILENKKIRKDLSLKPILPLFNE
jgi:hypothetical protein